jgi:photosystem II stability/assembly factor-like uncharacterized protein
MKHLLLHSIIIILFVSGCSKDMVDNPIPNKRPKTFLWLVPDTTVAEGNSKQRIRWWGEDPDGIIKGYLFSSGKLLNASGQISDTIPWRWRINSDTLIAFPLLVRQDTFQVIVRSVDNSFQGNLPDQALIRRLGSASYWDKNENGQFDAGDVELPSLHGAYDPTGATIGLPVLNQPPSMAFAQDPNDPSVTMQQPETTFTAATFSWVGTDPDGDQTITSYELALNDTTDSTRVFTVPGNIKLVSLVVPRSRSNGAVGEVTADVYKGTYQSSIILIGTLSHLKLDAFNTFYVRARDIAGDVSSFIQMPGRTATRSWYVKNPKGTLLIVNDYILSDRSSALTFYKTVFPQVHTGEFSNFEVLDIGRGLTAQQKLDGKFGNLVPPFVDPALMFTLHLFDVVYWYSDPYPSLGVAQYPLFQYVRDANHRGKVIFTSMFSTSVDPRQALKDFAPIDSVSSVDLVSPQRPLPTFGDTRIPLNFQLLPDSSDVSNLYPSLKFGGTTPLQTNYSVFMRPIYKRADAKYIYHIQNDTRVPPRYVYLATLSDLLSLAAVGSSAWASGVNGLMLHTSDDGQTWKGQSSGTTNSLNGIYFLDANTGWAVGDAGTIVQTSDGGTSWSKRSVLTFENLLAVCFTSSTNGVTGGTNGILIHSTNGGVSWGATNLRNNATIRSINFLDANIGLAVGDSDLITKTTDGGTTWRLIRKSAPGTINPPRLNSVKFADASTAWAVGANGRNLKSTDGGETWGIQPIFTGTELRSMYFIDNLTGWMCGTSGTIYTTVNGGLTWNGLLFPGSGVGEQLNSIAFANVSQGWCIGTGGIIIRSENAGASWFTQPKGNINVGVIDGIGVDGKRSFAFLGLPLHVLNGDGTNVKSFLEYVLFQEFGE